jgi:hypothetical protein
VDVHTYGQQRKRECVEKSLDGSDISVADEAGNDQRGRLLGAAHMDEHAFLHVHEVVVIEDGTPHRIKYAYYLVVDGHEIGGYERDPTHDPAEHFHCGEHEPGGVPHPAVSFKEAADHAWKWWSEHLRFPVGLEPDDES